MKPLCRIRKSYSVMPTSSLSERLESSQLRSMYPSFPPSDSGGVTRMFSCSFENPGIMPALHLGFPFPLHMPICSTCLGLLLEPFDLFLEFFIFRQLALEEANGDLRLFLGAFGGQIITVDAFVGIAREVLYLHPSPLHDGAQAIIHFSQTDAHLGGRRAGARRGGAGRRRRGARTGGGGERGQRRMFN